MALSERYTNAAVSEVDLSEMQRVTLDKLSQANRPGEVTRFVDADLDPVRPRAILVTEDAEPTIVEVLAAKLRVHRDQPAQFDSIRIKMSRAFIRDVADHLPSVQIQLDMSHLVTHASAARYRVRFEQRPDPSLQGLVRYCRRVPARERAHIL
jgi:transposase